MSSFQAKHHLSRSTHPLIVRQFVLVALGERAAKPFLPKLQDAAPRDERKDAVPQPYAPGRLGRDDARDARRDLLQVGDDRPHGRLIAPEPGCKVALVL